MWRNYCSFSIGQVSKRDWQTYGKRSFSNISRIIKKYIKNGDMSRKRGSGRPFKLSAQTRRKIGRAARKDRFITAATAIQTEYRLNEGDEKVSTRTIRRAITRETDWTKNEQWRKVMWTDESPFCLRFSGKLHVWRLGNERYVPRCMQGTTVKHDKKINVWGAFTAHGVGHLHRINGIMDQHIYRQILIHHMKPSFDQLFPLGDGIFQQDNDPKHCAMSVRHYINNQRFPQFNLLPFMFGGKDDSFRWPAQSPDLNPIENLWSIIDQKIKLRRPNNEEDLFEIIQNTWNNLDTTLLTKLADSMPARVRAVIANNGYPTKY
eukprot:gene17607-24461_t